MSVSAEGAAQQLSEQRGGVDEQLVAATADSLRQAASGDQLEEVRRATAAAVQALHSIVTALLAVIEGAAAKAADAAWPADAMPSVADVVAARAASADDSAMLSQRLSFKLTGMSQTTRNGTEAPVPPLGALCIRAVLVHPQAQLGCRLVGCAFKSMLVPMQVRLRLSKPRLCA